jgi:hypothetical protein
MKKILGATTLLLALGLQLPAQAQSVFAPTISFDSGNTIWGIENRTSLSNSMSLRSFVSFANSSPTANTRYGTSLNYSFDLGDEEKQFSPFLGIGYTTGAGNNNNATGFAQAGIDMYFETLILTGSVAIPFNGSGGTATSLGLGFRF